MLKGKPSKVVVVIPGGTKPEIEILLNHLDHEKEYFDECHLWLNTPIQHDIWYMKKIAKRFEFVTPIHRDFWCKNGLDCIGYFMEKCVQDKIYIRLDNDIVYIQKGAIKNLLNYRIRHKDLFMVFGNIVNNPFTFHLYQQRHIMDFGRPFNTHQYNDGRKSCHYMLEMHKKFLNLIRYRKVNRTHIENFNYHSSHLYIPINACSWYGPHLRHFGRIIGDEEPFLNSRNTMMGFVGNATFSHLSYQHQRGECYRINRAKEFHDIVHQYHLISKNLKML